MRFWKGLVIVCVVLLLGSLLAGSLMQSNEQSRDFRCQANLREFGVGLLKFTRQDPQTRYCTGAYDWLNDGCPDTVGWVADLLNSGHCRPGEMLCPENPMRGIEKLMELYLGNPGGQETGQPGSALVQAGICGAKPDVWGQAGCPERQHAIEQHILAVGHNTNYVASWYLVRGGLKLSVKTQTDSAGKVTSLEFSAVDPGPAKWRGLAGTTGPLRRKDVEKSKIPSSQIPLLGDGAPGDPARSISSVNLQNRGKVAITEGDRLVDSFNWGPAVYYEHEDQRLHRLPWGKPLGKGTIQGDGCTWEWTGLVVEKKSGDPYHATSPASQDTLSWFCHHGPKDSRTCNLLFADGSVRSIRDSDGDRLLNPGFQIVWGCTLGLRFDEPQIDRTSSCPTCYWGGEDELTSQQVFSGLFIVDPRETIVTEALRD